MKLIFTYLVFVSGFVCNSQSEIDYKAIDSLGRAFTAKLKQGNLEDFKNANPPKNTWTYSRLLDYKEDLNNSEIVIYSGDFIGPSVQEGIYAYNLFAYKKSDDKTFDYYFTAIVSIDLSDTSPRIENAYLFTEKEAIKSWWSHIFGLYYTNQIDNTPKEYSYPVCPPPPFKER